MLGVLQMVFKTMVPRASALIVMLVLILPAAYSMALPAPVLERDTMVIDTFLEGILDDTVDDRRLEVIVQFRDDVLPEDRRFVERQGLEVLHQYTIIPALWLKGTPRAIEALSASDRVIWIEHNEELEWMMDETTNVINATATWYSRIEGSLWGTGSLDGSGVTVVVVDSGVDAGHPDLDYGTKTIRNLKSDTGTGPWYEIENGDTSSGHGTHVAGTVAGNGDASAGSRAGVAPGANLIGLSVGELVFVTGGLGGLEWAYEHSRPGNNPYNIRVVTNSWGGGGGQYDPQDSISQAINNLVYDNNVVVTFAAGNSGGDGNTIQASNYGNTPAAIGVAATGRDGTYITEFSSKGMWNWVDTWPDVAAPGHYIESTAARRTIISLLAKGGDANPYYLAISGTSMATPHVAGAAAVIFQAAPSLRVSEVVEDAGIVMAEDGTYTVVPPEEGTYGNLPYTYDEWAEAPDTRIHEVELIMKLTADYIEPDGEGSADANGLTDNQVPSWSVPGNAGERRHDFSQGYGNINLQRAVGLALALERLRLEHPGVTVLDAYTVFEDIFEYKEVSTATDMLTTSWSGEWSRFTESPLKPATFSSNLTKFVLVPSGAEQVTVTMSYPPLDITGNLVAGSLGFTIDFGGDGSIDFDSGLGPTLDGTRTETIQASGNDGMSWRFEVYGVGFRVQRPLQQIQYKEARIEVEMSVGIRFPSGQGDIVVNQSDLHAINAFLTPTHASADYTEGNLTLWMNVYNLDNVQWSPAPEPTEPQSTSGFSLWWLLALFLFLLVAAYIIARFFPETKAGQLIIKVATATGAIKVYHWSKDTGVTVYEKVRGSVPKPKRAVVQAEVVDEGKGGS